MRGGISRGASLLVVGLLAAVLTAGATARTSDGGGISAFAESSSDRFERLLDASNYADFKPAALQGNGPVSVILQLEGAPVAQRDADTAAEKRAVRESLADRQEAVAAQVAALGGSVTHRYQDAFNGIAAVIPAAKLDALRAIEGVKRVSVSRTFRPDNAATAQFMNVPTVWNGATGFTGKGVVIAIIDSGVDYTHAMFGGAGTEAAYDAADAKDTTIEGNEFNAKVIGGYDFVGDDYDASSDDPAEFTPKPDPDPLDCDGHGSHVAGTAAGYGVLTNGKTYTGPWTSTTLSTVNFLVPPGMAPEAQILAYRVFGCGGSADEPVIVAAINAAVKDGADVINMSLGSPFGRPDEPSTIASNVAVDAGVVVVGSAGNSGSGAYITGAPNAADKSISVAALDASFAQLPGATINVPGGTVPAINANEANISGITGQLKVLRNPDGTVALGCNPADYAGSAGKIVVTLRGSCARVARAVYGQKAGAVAVVMINTSSAFPPFEGPIDENPDTGEEFLVTIPFLGVRGLLGPSPTDDGDRLVAADGQTVTLSPSTVTNPGFMLMASFTSMGPRNPDSVQKPDVTAPGVSLLSTNEDSGFRGARISGTSMAAPATAGVAALVRQANPTWSPLMVKGAIMNTAEAGTSKIAANYDVMRAGAGVVQADRAVSTRAMTTTPDGRNTLSYGYDQLTGAYSEMLPFTIHNTGTASITYNLSTVFTGGSRGADFSFAPSSVTVPAGGTAVVNATVALTAEEVAALPFAAQSNFGALLHAIDGVVVATPTATGPGIMPLRVPFMWVPRGLSNIEVTSAPSLFNPTIGLKNSGIHTGEAELFVLAQTDPNDVPPVAEQSTDIRAIGMQTLPREALCGTAPIGTCGTRDDRGLVFAINVWGRWSNPSVSEYDILVNTDRDPDPEFVVVGVDIGAVLAGAFDGRFASVIFNAETGRLVNAWVAEAPMNGSTLLLPVLASDLGLQGRSVRSPFTRLEFQAFSFSIVPADDGEEATPEVNTLDDITEPTSIGLGGLLGTVRSQPQSLTLAPGQSGTLGIQNALLQQTLGAKGWMVVTHDDANGPPQADLVAAPTIALPLP